MRWDDMYVDATGVWLPSRVAVAVADDPPVELAVRAGRLALLRSGHRPDEICLLLYATAGYQGIDSWNAAAYVEHNTIGGSHASSVEVRQLSNGALAALELAGGFLTAHPDRQAALLVTGDRFALPSFDRWRADSALVWGDGGTALVLSRTRGFARVVAVASTSDPSLEGLHRGDEPFRTGPELLAQPPTSSAANVRSCGACRSTRSSGGLLQVSARRWTRRWPMPARRYRRSATPYC